MVAADRLRVPCLLAKAFMKPRNLNGHFLGCLLVCEGWRRPSQMTVSRECPTKKVAHHFSSSAAEPPAINASFAYDDRKNLAFNGRALLTLWPAWKFSQDLGCRSRVLLRL